MNDGIKRALTILAGVFALLFAVLTPGAQAHLAYVANAGSGDVSAINIETGQVVGEPIPADEGSTAVAVTPDGKFAFVANYSASDVSVINTETNRVVGEPIEVSNSAFRATGVAISPDGKTVYVTSEGGLDPGELTRIDVATKQVIGQPLKLNTERAPLRSRQTVRGPTSRATVHRERCGWSTQAPALSRGRLTWAPADLAI